MWSPWVRSWRSPGVTSGLESLRLSDRIEGGMGGRFGAGDGSRSPRSPSRPSWKTPSSTGSLPKRKGEPSQVQDPEGLGPPRHLSGRRRHGCGARERPASRRKGTAPPPAPGLHPLRRHCIPDLDDISRQMGFPPSSGCPSPRRREPVQVTRLSAIGLGAAHEGLRRDSGSPRS